MKTKSFEEAYDTLRRSRAALADPDFPADMREKLAYKLDLMEWLHADSIAVLDMVYGPDYFPKPREGRW